MIPNHVGEKVSNKMNAQLGLQRKTSNLQKISNVITRQRRETNTTTNPMRPSSDDDT